MQEDINWLSTTSTMTQKIGMLLLGSFLSLCLFIDIITNIYKQKQREKTENNYSSNKPPEK